MTLIRHESLREIVAERLRADIIAGNLPSGSPLGLDALAERYGVSFTPVREALSSLEPTGFVVREPRKGYRVAPALTARQLLDVLDARQAIESRAALRAAARVTAKRLAELRANVLEQEARLAEHRAASTEAERTAALRGYFVADAAFHDLVIDSSQNPELVRLAATLSGHWHRARDTQEHGLIDGEDAMREHREIVAALSAHDPAAAEHAMSQHIERVVELVRRRDEATGTIPPSKRSSS